ncbi:MAG: glutamate--tRNA ligase [bacterium]
MSEIRLRLAPSPTGFLHIGNLRTALFGYLLAKSMQGRFILRIEDTDQSREVEGAVKSLLETLDWVGIKFDEGPHLEGDYAPYVQSQRQAIYQEHLKTLLEKGGAYYCFCTPERLKNMRDEQQSKKQAPRYDRTCRDLSPEEIRKRKVAGEKFVIRQKMPLTGEIIVHDELRGDIKFNAEDLEDHILIKSDGMPTYQFANVIDDHLMKISHVTRGEEWIPSFPKNVLLYKSFGWDVPKFIHLPLIMNKEGGKLSKRQGDVFVEDYRKNGYLPEALINFCALLGWHPKDDEEIFTIKELEKIFKLEDIRTSPAIFDIDKLNWFNGYYLRQTKNEYLISGARVSASASLSPSPPPDVEKLINDDDYIKQIIELEKSRIKNIFEIGEKTKYFFQEPEYDSELLIWKNLAKEEIKKNLEEILGQLQRIEEWTQENIDKTILNYLVKKKYKLGDYLWPMRVALTGEKNSPGPFEVAAVLGKETSLQRIKHAIQNVV